MLQKMNICKINADFLKKYVIWEPTGKIRVTRYFLYQNLYQQLGDLVNLTGQGIIFGGPTIISKFFPNITWTILDYSKDKIDITQIDTSQVTQKYNLVVADQVLEHVTHPWLVPENICKILTSNGYCIMATPFMCQVHGYPIDCYRFTELGLTNLFESHFKKVFSGSYGNLYVINLRIHQQKDMKVNEFKSNKYVLINDKQYPINVWYCGQRV